VDIQAACSNDAFPWFGEAEAKNSYLEQRDMSRSDYRRIHQCVVEYLYDREIHGEI